MRGKITRLPSKPPEPTCEHPYAQLDWLCERFALRYKNDATKLALRATVRAYKTLLDKSHGFDDRLVNDPRFLLSVHCDEVVLHNASLYWRKQKLSPHTVKARLQVLQALFGYAAECGLTASPIIFPVQVGPLQRSTLFRVAYEDNELEFIRKILAPSLDYAVRIVGGYKPTGVGVDARRGATRAASEPDSVGGGKELYNGIRDKPWAKWENMIWYFENVMKCRPVVSNIQKDATHSGFLQAASRYHGGINAVYHRLGVTSIIGIDLIAPLAIKLCLETGLNTETLLNLKRDCLKESHPLTGLPYIRYYKARSTGEKDLHLGLFDSAQDAMSLRHKQSLIIRRTINTILQLTQPLISKTRKPDKGFLFIYQADSHGFGAEHGRVIRLNHFYFSHWSRVLRLKTHADEENVPQVLNLGRCRPTKITQMVREGKDFFEIQAVAGHASASTTQKYLASHQIAPQARREVSETLSRIHENAEDFESNPKPYATAETQRQKGVIYKGVFCDCKDVYDPPSSVKRLPTYREGQPCTYYNMCLTCPNVLIIKKHLPLLIAYQSEISMALSGGLNDAPNSAHYAKSLAVLDGIMLEFDKADVEWAREIANCADYHLDPLTHRAVTNDV